MQSMTMNEIIFEHAPYKTLQKLKKKAPSDYFKIADFIFEDLTKTQEPLKLPNCTKLVAFSDNSYRWRLGDHRIIAKVSKGNVHILQIIHIGKRGENTYG